jgi:hypothetical protein
MAALIGCTSAGGATVRPDGGEADHPASPPDVAIIGDRAREAPEPDAPASLDVPAPDARDGAGPPPAACNALVAPLLGVDVYHRNVSPPPALGGLIVDGTYTLFVSLIYQGPGGPPSGPASIKRGSTLVVTGQSFDRVLAEQAVLGKIVRERGTFSASGTTLGLQYACPEGAPAETLDYTARGRELTLYLHPSPGVTEERAYTRQ